MNTPPRAKQIEDTAQEVHTLTRQAIDHASVGALPPRPRRSRMSPGRRPPPQRTDPGRRGKHPAPAGKPLRIGDRNSPPPSVEDAAQVGQPEGNAGASAGTSSPAPSRRRNQARPALQMTAGTGALHLAASPTPVSETKGPIFGGDHQRRGHTQAVRKQTVPPPALSRGSARRGQVRVRLNG